MAIKQNDETAGRGTELGLGANGDNIQGIMFTVLNLDLGGIQKAASNSETWEATH